MAPALALSAHTTTCPAPLPADGAPATTYAPSPEAASAACPEGRESPAAPPGLTSVCEPAVTSSTGVTVAVCDGEGVIEAVCRQRVTTQAAET